MRDRDAKLIWEARQGRIPRNKGIKDRLVKDLSNMGLKGKAGEKKYLKQVMKKAPNLPKNARAAIAGTDITGAPIYNLSYPEPRPTGLKITSTLPSFIKLDANNFLNFHTALSNFIKDNKLKVKSLGEGGGFKSLNPFTSSKAAKNWLEISNKLLLEKVYTDDISGWDPSSSVVSPFKPSSDKHDETRKKLAAAKQRFGKNEHYISVYSPEWFGEDPNAPKSGLTKNQVYDIIKNIAGDSYLRDVQKRNIGSTNQDSMMRLLDNVAIIKMGIEPVDEERNLNRREKNLAGSYKIELVYADEDSTPPLNDLYDSTIPLEIKRFIDKTLNEKSKFKEGEKSETSSLTRSRSKSLIEKAKEENIEKYGALTCMKCGVQPAKDYYFKNQKVSPSLAYRIIEGHHIHGVRETDKATTKDIELLCRNCHIYETRISK